jgi:sortase A
MNRTSRSRADQMMRVLERALFVIAVASLGWYGSVRIAAAREQAALSSELEAGARSVRPTGLLAGAVRELPLHRALVARVEIPRLKLSAVAREGVDEHTLATAVGHVPGTSLPGAVGNAAFAAHRDTFFRPLRHVKAGDDVIVTTRGASYHYMVTGTQIVEPGDVSVLDSTPASTLTLITCYPFDFVGSAPQRFVVRAVLRDDGA